MSNPKSNAIKKKSGWESWRGVAKANAANQRYLKEKAGPTWADKMTRKERMADNRDSFAKKLDAHKAERAHFM